MFRKDILLSLNLAVSEPGISTEYQPLYHFDLQYVLIKKILRSEVVTND